MADGLILNVALTPVQVGMLEEFRQTENLPSRLEALQLLLEIAFEAVTAPGQRFWDKPPDPAWQAQEIYRSSNGDTWHLLRDTISRRMLVRHTPNSSSGGQAHDEGVEDFLAKGGHGPEHSALRALLRGVDQGT